MDFRPITAQEQTKLIEALRGNAESNFKILMKPSDTSFLGVERPGLDGEGVSDDEVISAIQSVPCHY